MITVKTQICRNDEDTLMFIILDNNGNELLKEAIYIDNEYTKKMPTLKSIENDLPKLLEMVYNSGKNGEEVRFATEEIALDV